MSAGPWRPVQGPVSMVPGSVAATGHVIGTVYASHYWGGTYRATHAHADGSVSVRWLSGDDAGRSVRHRTRLHPDGTPNSVHDDHPVSQACRYRIACRKRRAVL